MVWLGEGIVDSERWYGHGNIVWIREGGVDRGRWCGWGKVL